MQINFRISTYNTFTEQFNNFYVLFLKIEFKRMAKMQTCVVELLQCFFSLRSYLEAFLEQKDTETSWIEKMPEQILVKNVVSLFEYSVQMQQQLSV